MRDGEVVCEWNGILASRSDWIKWWSWVKKKTNIFYNNHYALKQNLFTWRQSEELLIVLQFCFIEWIFCSCLLSFNDMRIRFSVNYISIMPPVLYRFSKTLGILFQKLFMLILLSFKWILFPMIQNNCYLKARTFLVITHQYTIIFWVVFYLHVLTIIVFIFTQENSEWLFIFTNVELQENVFYFFQ